MQPTRFLIATAALAAAAAAQFNVVIPAGRDTVAGNGSNSFPWGYATTAYAGMRHQQIYDSSNLTSQSINTPILIQGMRLREGAGGTHPGGVTYQNVVIQMATCPLDYTAASAATAWAGNLNPDLTTVFSGNVTTMTSTGATPNNWIIDIAFTTPFLYDPSTGSDLVIDVDRPLQAGTSFYLDNVSGAATVPPPLGTRVYGYTAYPAPTSHTVDYTLVTELVYVPAAGLYPNFTATPTSTPLNTPVNFTDNSYSSDPGGILAWAWDVNGDSVVDYTTQNCSHSYTTEGYYDVSLTVVDGTHGSATTTRTQYIAVDTCEASFSLQVLPGSVAVFTDTSAGTPTSWAWDVDGDSVVDYTTQNCAHVYPGPGQHNVTLTVTDAISTDTVTTPIGIDIIPVPGFGNTFSSATLTRGLWFQAPVKFSIVSAAVPDETANGTQNVAIYRLAGAPPVYASTGTGGLEFAAQGVPSNVPTPCVVSFDAGEYVGVLGACGTSTMLNSYATPTGAFASSVLGVPTTLTRFGTQNNLWSAVDPNTLPYWQEPAGAISRIVLVVTSAAGVPYGDGSPSGAGPAAPRMRCTALPFIGQTTTLAVEQNDTGALGFMVLGLGRASVPSPFGTILIGNILANSIMTPGIVGPGTYNYSWNVPNNAAFIGIDVNFQYAQLLVATSQVALSNGIEMQFAQ